MVRELVEGAMNVTLYIRDSFCVTCLIIHSSTYLDTVAGVPECLPRPGQLLGREGKESHGPRRKWC